MFGPLVEEAVAKYAKLSHELLSALQLFGATQKLTYGFAVEETEAIAFGARKNVVLRVPLEDPVIVREEMRLNIT